MQRRTLGKTGLSISPLALGGLFTSDLGGGVEATTRVLERAFDLGINFIDTAPAYANSEQTLGEALKQTRNTPDDLVLSTMGRGFWIMDNLSVLHQLNATMDPDEHHLFTPDIAYRTDYNGGSYNSGSPEYPEPGAMIDFYLADTTASPVVLEILDDEGNRVRSFVASFGKEKEDGEDADEVNMKAPGSIPGTAGNLNVRPGHNRFIWNLRYPGKTVTSDEGEIYFGVNAGPTSVPGTYTVRLTAGSRTFEEPLTVKMNPRVKAEGVTDADLRAQLSLNKDIRNAIGRAGMLAARIDSFRTKVKKASEEHTGDGDWQQSLAEIDRTDSLLVTSEKGSYPPPMLIDQLEYLYFMTISADQRPGRDAYQRFYALRAELNEIEAQWKELRSDIDIEELNGGGGR